jgi:hypothetical protein
MRGYTTAGVSFLLCQTTHENHSRSNGSPSARDGPRPPWPQRGTSARKHQGSPPGCALLACTNEVEREREEVRVQCAVEGARSECGNDS